MLEAKKLERDYKAFWSKSNYGHITIAIQYDKSGGNGYKPEQNPENRPIYVGFDGDNPRDLEEVLMENEQLKKGIIKGFGDDIARIDFSLSNLKKDVIDLVDKIIELRPKKKWYQFWK